MKQKQNLTIDDVARALGVSKTTVSRAISGKGRIGAATRQRVLDYIELHNYRPNAAAKGLAEQRTYNLALVLPRSFLGLDLPFVRRSMSAICEEAFLHDYNVMVCLSTGNQSDPLVRTLDHRKVDGVILSRTVENDSIIDLLIRREIPFATLGSLPPRYQGCAAVEADHRQTEGCYAFARAVVCDGRGSVGLLGNDLSYIVNQSRLTGFLQACRDLGMCMEQTPIRVGLGTPDAVRTAVLAMLDQQIRRFVCMDDEVCLQTLAVLDRMGRSDCTVFSLCDSDALAAHVPPVSAVEFDPAELGRTACRELLHCLGGGAYDPTPRLGFVIHMR